MKVGNLQWFGAKMLRQIHEAKLPPHKTLVSRPHAETPWLPNGGHDGTQLRAKLGVNMQTGRNPVKIPENLDLRLDAIVAYWHPPPLVSRHEGFSG
jgi:hypothetical protein